MGFLHCSICPPYVEITKLWNTSLVPIQWAKPHDATKMPQLLCVKLEDPKKFTSQALRRSRSIIHLPAAPPGHSGAGRERVASVRRRSTACCGRCCVPRCSGMEPLQGFAGLGCHPCRTHAGLDYTTHRLRPDQQPRAGVTAGIPRRPKALPALLCVLWAPRDAGIGHHTGVFRRPHASPGLIADYGEILYRSRAAPAPAARLCDDARPTTPGSRSLSRLSSPRRALRTAPAPSRSHAGPPRQAKIGSAIWAPVRLGPTLRLGGSHAGVFLRPESLRIPAVSPGPRATLTGPSLTAARSAARLRIQKNRQHGAPQWVSAPATGSAICPVRSLGAFCSARDQYYSPNRPLFILHDGSPLTPARLNIVLRSEVRPEVREVVSAQLLGCGGATRWNLVLHENCC